MNAAAGESVAVVEMVAAESPAQGRRRPLSRPKGERRSKVIKNLSEPTAIPEDDVLLERQYYGVAEAFKPRNRWQEWLTARISTLMLRISRADRVERKLRDWASYRAFDFWEDDQKLAVEELGQRLKRDPAKVAAKLRQSPAGLDWLAARWHALAKLRQEDWTDERREQAYQLLGGDERVDPATPGFVAAQLDGLEADRERVEEADAILRGLVESDLSDKDVPDLARLRREVRAWHRQMKWCADQFHVEHGDRWDDPMRRPAHEKVTPDGFREVNYDLFEGPRPLEPLTPPAAPPVAAPAPRPAAPAPRPAAPAATAAVGREKNDGTKPTASVVAVAAAASSIRPASRMAPIVEATAPDRPRTHAERLKRARRRASLDLAERL